MEILTKSIGHKWFFVLRGRIGTCQNVEQIFGELYGRLGPKSVGGLPVASPLRCRELPAQVAACSLNCARYASLGSARQRPTAWIKERNLAIAGPPRKIYLQMSSPVRNDDESYVTELQIPVRPV